MAQTGSIHVQKVALPITTLWLGHDHKDSSARATARRASRLLCVWWDDWNCRMLHIITPQPFCLFFASWLCPCAHRVMAHPSPPLPLVPRLHIFYSFFLVPVSMGIFFSLGDNTLWISLSRFSLCSACSGQANKKKKRAPHVNIRCGKV